MKYEIIFCISYFNISTNSIIVSVPIKYERKIQGNVLTKMADMKGPLASLKKCVEERIRIKVK